MKEEYEPVGGRGAGLSTMNFGSLPVREAAVDGLQIDTPHTERDDVVRDNICLDQLPRSVAADQPAACGSVKYLHVSFEKQLAFR